MRISTQERSSILYITEHVLQRLKNWLSKSSFCNDNLTELPECIYQMIIIDIIQNSCLYACN